MERRDQNSLVIAQVQELASSLFLDLQSHHPHLVKDLSLDFRSFTKRIEFEGLGFATHSLPRLGKAIYKSLETGLFVCPCGFSKMKGTALPRFLGGLLKCCYTLDGSLKDDLDQPSLTDLIQICFLFYKLNLPYSARLNSKVIKAFVKTEEDLEKLAIEDDLVIQEATDLAEKILSDFNPMDILPRHGPGAVATGEKGSKKWVFSRKYESIHKVYPYYEYFVPSRRSLLDSISWYKNLEQHESGCAKVTLVPKDSRGPRLISMEPLEYQFIQQGISRALVEYLEKKCPFTRGRVNFTDQGINRNLALHNSCTKRYATLDMKEASDRVSLQLVRRIFHKNERFLRAIEATRSTHTELPSGEILKLRKFAPMGSALCFPVEALIFFVLIKSIMKRERIRGSVYVYGDDIIVPVEVVPHLFEQMPKYGLMFNEDKCFISGYFRESCGMDAYKGNVCVPVRMRSILPRSRKEASAIVSAVEFSNYLFQRGYWKSARYVEDSVKGILNIDVLKSPKVNFGALAFTSFTSKGVITGDRTRTRFNKDLQCYESLLNIGYQPVKRRKSLSNDAILFMNLVNQRQWTDAVPHAAAIKMRWYPIYS